SFPNSSHETGTESLARLLSATRCIGKPCRKALASAPDDSRCSEGPGNERCSNSPLRDVQCSVKLTRNSLQAGTAAPPRVAGVNCKASRAHVTAAASSRRERLLLVTCGTDDSAPDASTQARTIATPCCSRRMACGG